jgi:hypothetical protein
LYCGWIANNYRFLLIVGYNVHTIEISISSLMQMLRIINVGRNISSVLIALIKTAILLEFIRIFVPRSVKNTFWWFCCILIGLNVAVYFAVGLLLTNLACIPRESMFDFRVPGKCIGISGFKTDPFIEVVSASVNVVSDIMILLLPQPLIWRLQMPLKSKIAILSVFFVGLLGCMASTVRLVMAVRLSQSDDPVYSFASLTLWVTGDMTCMFLVFCAPALRNALGHSDPLRSCLGIRKAGSQEKSKSNRGFGASDSDASVQVVGTEAPFRPYGKVEIQTAFHVDTSWDYGQLEPTYQGFLREESRRGARITDYASPDPRDRSSRYYSWSEGTV